MNSWIFQGNPKRFNIDKYITENENIWWSLRQKHFISDISIGDEVYLWRSDGNDSGSGGIIARAVVTGNITERTDEDNKEYWYNDDWRYKGLGVPLKILDTRLNCTNLNRLALQEHDFLSNLLILHMRNATNYMISKEQSDAIKNLWENELDILDYEDDYTSFPEGQVKYKMHRTIERNKTLVKIAKSAYFKKHGELRCEVCGFSFFEVYGDIGLNYIEAHHITPMAEIGTEYIANVQDIILVCSNCHRMLHRKRPCLNLEELKLMIRKSNA